MLVASNGHSPLRVVCLGTCCSASARLRRLGLKRESSMVEWMMAIDFREVLRLLEAVADDAACDWPVEAVSGKLVRFAGTHVCSRHYASAEALQRAFARRAKRLRGWIANGDRVLFVRHDARLLVTDADCSALFDIARRVNPAHRARLLVFTPPTLWQQASRLGHPRARRVVLPRDDAAYLDSVCRCDDDWGGAGASASRKAAKASHATRGTRQPPAAADAW